MFQSVISSWVPIASWGAISSWGPMARLGCTSKWVILDKMACIVQHARLRHFAIILVYLHILLGCLTESTHPSTASLQWSCNVSPSQ